LNQSRFWTSRTGIALLLAWPLLHLFHGHGGHGGHGGGAQDKSDMDKRA
jgi:hypothetical protein